MNVYAGIGSRQTPDDILELMSQLTKKLAWGDWTLRTGGADGADFACELGAWSAICNPLAEAVRGRTCPGKIEVYLPWAKFNANKRAALAPAKLTEPQRAAFQVAARFHPTWDKLTDPVKALMARNAHQIMGPDVNAPVLSKFVVCWTPEGSGAGGTGQAIRMAQHYKIPVFDLALVEPRRRIEAMLEGRRAA